LIEYILAKQQMVAPNSISHCILMTMQNKSQVRIRVRDWHGVRVSD